MTIFNKVIIFIAKLLLLVRYKIKVKGLEKISLTRTKGTLFLPNHPAMIDPIILLTILYPKFTPAIVGDSDQINQLFVKTLSKLFNVIELPDLAKYGIGSVDKVDFAMKKAIEHIRKGNNLIFYPSGHLYRTYLEDLRGNTGVKRIIDSQSEVRVVLIRTKGLWGSSFSYAFGQKPQLKKIFSRAISSVLKSLIFFVPKRIVEIDFYEFENIKSYKNKEAINIFLEKFYNKDAPPNTYVPYTPWSKSKTRFVDEPLTGYDDFDISNVSYLIKEKVYGYLKEKTGLGQIHYSDDLAKDLNMDSIVKLEVLSWLESEFGFSKIDIESLVKVSDLLQAASGKAIGLRITAPSITL